MNTNILGATHCTPMRLKGVSDSAVGSDRTQRRCRQGDYDVDVHYVPNAHALEGDKNNSAASMTP